MSKEFQTRTAVVFYGIGREEHRLEMSIPAGLSDTDASVLVEQEIQSLVRWVWDYA